MKKLQQDFINLLDNAVQHSPAGSTIEIEILPGGESSVEVRVVDRGSGLPDEVLPRVFDTFFTTRRGGTGLGLNIITGERLL
jgi:signal transduction histidine kinase